MGPCKASCQTPRMIKSICILWWLHLIVLLCSNLCYGRKADADAVLSSCFNQNCIKEKTTWENFKDDKPECLTAARTWVSAKPDNFPVTLVTQLSADRLRQLKAQCQRWQGPYAAALYLPLYNPEGQLTESSRSKLEIVAAGVDAVFSYFERRSTGCQLRLVLVYEVFAEQKAVVLYPLNSLRNYARLLSDTELIANIDIDMIPSTSLSTALKDPYSLQALTAGCKQGKVYVLPAFETRCGNASYADQVTTYSRSGLVQEIVETGCVGQMRGKVFTWSHRPTNYSLWVKSTEPYRVDYELLFEPWFISLRRSTLWYDTRFRGYGKNKIVQVSDTNSTGFEFMIYHDAFLVHRPHQRSVVASEFVRTKVSTMHKEEIANLESTVYGHVEKLYAEVSAQIAAGKYQAHVEPRFTACVKQLSWWQWDKE